MSNPALKYKITVYSFGLSLGIDIIEFTNLKKVLSWKQYFVGINYFTKTYLPLMIVLSWLLKLVISLEILKIEIMERAWQTRLSLSQCLSPADVLKGKTYFKEPYSSVCFFALFALKMMISDAIILGFKM